MRIFRFIKATLIAAVTVLPSALTAETDTRQFHAENGCHVAVRLAVRYQGVDGTWVTVGWFTISPGESGYLADDDGRLESARRLYFIYADAESTKRKSRFVWRGETKDDADRSFVFQGQERVFRFAYGHSSADVNRLKLTCKNEKPERLVNPFWSWEEERLRRGEQIP